MQINTPCIEWPYSRNIKDGNRLDYGQVRVGDKMRKAHRVAWEKEHGPIPQGMLVLHRCDNPPCVNVDHLYLGTHADNARDRSMRGRGGGRKIQGSSNARAKVSELTAVRLKIVNGAASPSALAKVLPIKVQVIWKIMRGGSWQHVSANTRYAF